MDPVLVGQRVEACRLKSGLNKGEFAAAIQLDASSYSKIIKGEKPLKPEQAYLIWEVVSVPMDFLYRGDLSKIEETQSKALIANLAAVQE